MVLKCFSGLKIFKILRDTTLRVVSRALRAASQLIIHVEVIYLILNIWLLDYTIE